MFGRRAPNGADIAYAAYLAAEELARQQEVVKARDYHAGGLPTELATELGRAMITGKAGDIEGWNLARAVVHEILYRLEVRQARTGELDEASGVWQGADAAQDAWIASVWGSSAMDYYQHEVHEALLRDGEFFVIVDYDAGTGMARLHPHERYTDPAASGNGQGCKAHYVNDDPHNELAYVSKRWTEVLYDPAGNRQTRQRMTLYYPDRVEKYELATVSSSEAGWQPLRAPGEAWPLPWKDGSGQPLGIPVCHFLIPEPLARQAWGGQTISDNFMISFVASTVLHGFPSKLLTGAYPTTDGQPLADDNSNALELGPGRIVGVLSPEAKWQNMEPGDLSQLTRAIEFNMVMVAATTNTPSLIQHLAARGNLPAEALNQMREIPIALALRLQTRVGDGWEKVIRVARRLANALGDAGMDEGAPLTIVWKDAAVVGAAPVPATAVDDTEVMAATGENEQS